MNRRRETILAVLSVLGMAAVIATQAGTQTLDKVSPAVEEALKANPLGGAAFGSMTDQSGHRDELVRTNATYK